MIKLSPKLMALFIPTNPRYNILMEDLTQQLPYLIKLFSQKYPDKSQEEMEQLITDVSDLDPTEDKNLTQTLLTWVIDNSFRYPEDKEKVQKLIKDYLSLKQKDPVLLKNFPKYSSPQELSRDIDKQLRPEELIAGQRQEKISEIAGLPGVKELYNDGRIAVLEISNADSMVKLSSGTKWCTSNKSTTRDYLKNGLFYLFYRNGKKYALAHLKSKQFMNIRDEPIQADNELVRIIKKVLPKSIDIT